MAVRVTGIDHVQIAAPQGCESAAREFYGALLGLVEIEKPPILRARGGCRFQCGPQQLHVGVEKSFQAARKAHPAFLALRFDELRIEFKMRGITVTDDTDLPGTRRFYAEDPWGNRLEFIDASV